MSNKECKSDDDIVSDIVLLMAIICAWIIGGLLFTYVFFAIRACILWVYYNYYLRREIDFDLLLPDPWCCSVSE